MRIGLAGTLALAGMACAADPHWRFARVMLAEGRVEIEHARTGERYPAARNQPVGQGFWIETQDGRVELELDEGTQIRLGPASLAELSDLTRLSTGQRVTLISLEHGTLYVTGEPPGMDTLVVVAPGLEVSFLAGSRIRVDAGGDGSTVSILEGRVKLTARSVEMELQEGRAARIADQFQLLSEAPGGELDAWSEQRDRDSAERDPELDNHGEWIEVTGQGRVWRPSPAEGFVPYRAGRWRWYDELGFTWIASEAWGWSPYHFGRWIRTTSYGWVWSPGDDDLFQAGHVFWLQGPGFAGWGPTGGDASEATYAQYTGGSREVDPARAPRARGAGQRVPALPSPPPLPPALRRSTRVGATRVIPRTPEHAFDARLPEPPTLIVSPVVIESPPPEPAIQVAPLPGPVYIPVPHVVVLERETPAPAPEPPPPPAAQPDPPPARPPVQAPPPAPAPPVVPRTIRLRDPESGDARSRRR